MLRWTAWVALAAGGALFVGLIVWHGVGDVAEALAVAGWGLFVVALYHLLPMGADVLAWRTLFRPPRPSPAGLAWARWVHESVNSLLPVPQVAGDVARAHALAATGVPGRLAGATVVVDLTLSALTQIFFTLAGLALLLGHGGLHEAVWSILLGLALFGAMLWAFYRLQRRGLFGAVVRGLARAVGRQDWLRMAGGADAVDEAIARVYAHPRAVLASAAWNLASWTLGTGEVWLAMYFLGVPVSFAEAFVLESLGQAVRAAAVAVPAGLGVQEGGYVFLGALLGLSGDVSLALSLAKRARELLIGVPGLVAWQLTTVAAGVTERER